MTTQSKSPDEDLNILVVDNEDDFLTQFKRDTEKAIGDSWQARRRNIVVHTSGSFREGLQRINNVKDDEFDIILVDEDLDGDHTYNEFVENIESPISAASVIKISNKDLNKQLPYIDKTVLNDNFRLVFASLINLIIMKEKTQEIYSDKSFNQFIVSIKSVDMQVDNLQVHIHRFSDLNESVELDYIKQEVDKLAEILHAKRTQIMPAEYLLQDHSGDTNIVVVDEGHILESYLSDFPKKKRNELIDKIIGLSGHEKCLEQVEDLTRYLCEIFDKFYSNKAESRWQVWWKVSSLIKKVTDSYRCQVDFLNLAIFYEIDNLTDLNVARLEYSIALALHELSEDSAASQFFESALENSAQLQEFKLHDKIATTIHSIIAEESAA